MATLLIMLALLVAPALVNELAARLAGKCLCDCRTAGCIGIALVFCFTATGHFVLTKPMAEMLPEQVPWRVPLIYVTGVLEFVAAFMVLVPRWRRGVGILLIVALICFLPVNVYAVLNGVGLGKQEWGLAYLLVRVPVQFVLIGWVWWFAVRRSEMTRGRR